MNTVTIKGPLEMAAVLPHMIGHYPHHSTVLVINGTCETPGPVLIRFDNDPELPSPESLHQLRSRMLEHGLDSGSVFVFDNEEPLSSFVRAVRIADIVGIELDSGHTITNNLLTTMSCDEPCCPHGEPVPAPPTHLAPLTNQLATPATSRPALAITVEANTDADTVGALIKAHPAPTLRDTITAWKALLTSATIDHQTLATAAAGLATTNTDAMQARDVIISTLCGLPIAAPDFTADAIDLAATMPTNTTAHTVVRLVDIAASLPDEHAVAALTVLAVVAWSRGNAVLTEAASVRALRVDPQCRLAHLALMFFETGIPFSRNKLTT